MSFAQVSNDDEDITWLPLYGVDMVPRYHVDMPVEILPISE